MSISGLCRLFVKTSRESAKYRLMGMSALQEMSTDVRKSWIAAITNDESRDRNYEGADEVSRGTYVLGLDGSVGVLD